MITLERTNINNFTFINLVKELDADLAIKDGKDHTFYNQYNKLDTIKNVIVAYEYGKAVGCGALKEYSNDTVEIKRMFVSKNQRNKGIATKILLGLEKWSRELGYKKSILETGKRQPDAISLYKKNGYIITANYGQYTTVENSVCFEKLL